MIAVVAVDPCHQQPCQHRAAWWLEEQAVLERLAVEIARPGGSPLAAARALFTREDQPHA